MSDFSKTRRQKFLNEKDYVGEEEAFRDGIQSRYKSLASDMPKALGADSRLRWAIASKSLELLLLNYTAGRPIEELREAFPELVERFYTYIAHEISPRKETPPRNVADTLEITQIDAYVYVFWLLALCKLLRQGEYVPKVMEWVNRTRDFNRGRDGLFENVVQALTGSSAPDTPRVVLFADPYRPLASATVRAPEERPALVKTFVEGWYKGMKNTYWHGAHTDGLYFGYWCLEAALVTVLFDIDDTSYRDALVYPKDLVDWYRGHPGVGTDPKPPSPKRVLSARPGETCPQSGEWIAPNLLNKKVKLRAGDIMPGPETGPTGGVYWYLEALE